MPETSWNSSDYDIILSCKDDDIENEIISWRRKKAQASIGQHVDDLFH